MSAIPVIDLAAFRNGNAVARQTVVKQTYQACHDIGFMYLQNSGMSKDLIQQFIPIGDSPPIVPC